MQMLKRGLELVLRRRDFGLLMATQFLGQAGDGIVQAALAKLIVFGGQQGFDVEGARSPDELLRIVLYIFVPYTILSPFFGVVIDRWDRRRLLMLANGIRGVAVLLVALVGTGNVGDVALFAVFLLTLASTRVMLATKAAALPVALGEGSLVEANAVSQFGGAMFQLGGAGAAIVAASFLSTGPIVFVGALVYVAAALVAARLEKVGRPRQADRTLIDAIAEVARRIWEGIVEVARTPAAAASISTYFWLRFLWSAALVGISFLARTLLSDDDLMVLVVTGGAGAAGAVLGFMAAGALRQRVERTALLVLGPSLLAGAATVVLALVPGVAALGALAFFLGAGFFVGKISLDSLVQESLGDGFRGRAFSLYDIAYNLAWVLAALVLKLFYDEDTLRELISGLGVLFLLGLASLAAWYRRAGLLRSAPADNAAP